MFGRNDWTWRCRYRYDKTILSIYFQEDRNDLRCMDLPYCTFPNLSWSKRQGCKEDKHGRLRGLPFTAIITAQLFLLGNLPTQPYTSACDVTRELLLQYCIIIPSTSCLNRNRSTSATKKGDTSFSAYPPDMISTISNLGWIIEEGQNSVDDPDSTPGFGSREVQRAGRVWEA